VAALPVEPLWTEEGARTVVLDEPFVTVTLFDVEALQPLLVTVTL
jgi:hypothetical protein